MVEAISPLSPGGWFDPSDGLRGGVDPAAVASSPRIGPLRPKVTIVLATLNERETLPQLIAQIRELGLVSYEVVVVDDGSTDGTVEFVTGAARTDSKIRAVLHKGRRTLGPAIFQGIAASRGDYIVVMDADGQHPVALLPRLISQLDGGASLVVASRYGGGGSAGDRSPVRATISRTAEVIARVLLPDARRIRDPLSGFFCFRRSLSNNLVAPTRGYKPLLALLRLGNGSIVEVPYVFGSRGGGRSKITASIRFVPNFMSEILTARRLSAAGPRLSSSGSSSATTETSLHPKLSS